MLRVVAHVCVHQEYEGARGQLQAVDVRTAEAHFSRPRQYDHSIGAVKPLQLLGYL